MKEYVLPIIQTIGLGVVLPIFAGWIALHVRNKFLRDALVGVAQRAAGISYDYLASRSSGMSPEQARREAFAAGLSYMETAGQPFSSALGVDIDVTDNMVRGQLGTLLAQDSSVTVAPQLVPVPTAPITLRNPLA